MRHARSDYNRFQDPDGKIPDDEPVFLIRAQDICGPRAVACYAEFAELAGADPDLVSRCRQWAGEMDRWQLERQAGKVPDLEINS